MKRTLTIAASAVSASLILVGSAPFHRNGDQVSADTNPYPYTQLSTGFSKETVDGVTLQSIGTGVRDTELWSPSGSTFTFTINPQKGNAVIGTISPFHTQHVSFGTGRTIVALNDKFVVVTSWSANQDWLYPLHRTTLGRHTRILGRSG